MSDRFWNRVKLSPFFIKLIHWEFWPFYVVYFPVYFYLLWLAIKARSLFFFTASNPGVDTGGMFGESKWSVLQKVPTPLIPKTVFVKSGTLITQILQALELADIRFPLIAKPDIGERGFLVEKIDDAKILEGYLSGFKIDFILQEYIDHDFEYNVLYYRLPGESKGTISSVTTKVYLSVTGDGKSSVNDLMKREMRAALQVDRFQREKPELMNFVPPDGKVLRIEPIGNHARGTTFLDGRNLVDDAMIASFDDIASQIPDMNMFRFDVKCKSLNDLRKGCIKIVELNGVGGEPTHIYEPGYPLLKAWVDLLKIWKIIYRISCLNHKNGVCYMPLAEGVSKLRAYAVYKTQF